MARLGGSTAIEGLLTCWSDFHPPLRPIVLAWARNQANWLKLARKVAIGYTRSYPAQLRW
jgi:hypothetical protein